MNLKDATALITGGSSGIGFAIAKSLIEAGTRVAITGRDEKKLYKAAEMLNAVPLDRIVRGGNSPKTLPLCRTTEAGLVVPPTISGPLSRVKSSAMKPLSSRVSAR